jgi:hypothetical protein
MPAPDVDRSRRSGARFDITGQELPFLCRFIPRRSYSGPMRFRAGIAAVLVVCAHAASACITVELSPRERFREAAVIVRAKAGEIFLFEADRSWRGGIPRGAEIVAEYDPLGCGVPKIEEGKEYLLYSHEAPRLEGGEVWVLPHARFLPMETAQREIAFLDRRGAKPLTARELADVLSEWKRGRMSHDRFRAWLVQAATRDVDDWREVPAEGRVSPMSELLDLLSGLLHPAPPVVSREIADCRATIVRTHVDTMLEFLRWPERPLDELGEKLSNLEEALGEETSQFGC